MGAPVQWLCVLGEQDGYDEVGLVFGYTEDV